jgi:hypothetical protein
VTRVGVADAQLVGPADAGFDLVGSVPQDDHGSLDAAVAKRGEDVFEDGTPVERRQRLGAAEARRRARGQDDRGDLGRHLAIFPPTHPSP